MEQFNEDQIKQILNQYAKKRNREKNYYHDVNKNNEEFQKKNRERAKKHYETNKEKKKESYETNKEFLRARQLYYYYKKIDNLEKMKEKYPEKCEILVKKGIKV
tara:strand:+ start:476 stop:787 length:312 start_codon:yes stop_codon:yes gene_type:complete